MPPSIDRRVDITENGRSGTVIYHEPGGTLTFYWEFGGGDAVACIHVGTTAVWQREHAWATDRRAGILRFVADEVVRLKAPTCAAEIDEDTGWMNLRQRAPAGISGIDHGPSPGAPVVPARTDAGAWFRRYSRLRMKMGLSVLAGGLILAGIMWFKNKVLVIDPGKGVPIGLCVRTDTHIATLIQTLEAYTPSLHRDGSKDRFTVSLFLVPLDGSAPKLIPIVHGRTFSSFQLAKVLGSDGRTLWYDVNGVGGVDLKTFGPSPTGSKPDADTQLQGAHTSPFPTRPEAFLCAGFLTGPKNWLGLHSTAEVGRAFAPKQFVRRVERQESAEQLRGFYRADLDPPVDHNYHRIRTVTPTGSEEYLNAAFLRIDDTDEPLRLSDPDGALMVYTAEPGRKGTLMIARVDTSGSILWKVDTGINRFKLNQILPGKGSIAFVGTRPPIPDKVSEPLLVIVDNRSGEVISTSLWQ